MKSKQDILDEISRTAINGVPLGKDTFQKETGINMHDIMRYWARFGDAQIEAGYSPNTLKVAYEEIYLIENYIKLIRELGKIPVQGNLKVKRNTDNTFPNYQAFDRLGSKTQLIKKVYEFSKANSIYEDITDLCLAFLAKPDNVNSESVVEKINIGEVYLFKSGRYYKIGKTNDTVRRGKELRIQLPEKLDLIHSIKTDDPSGIETYWHKRFEAKRKNGEWFDLNASDIKAFKSWKRIV